MEGLSIVPVEVLSMVSTQGGVRYMKESILSSGNSRLHESWQLAVTHLDTDSCGDLTQRDVQHVKKFRNLESFTSSSRSLFPRGMPGWQLVSEVAPTLRKLRSIKLAGPSSFEVLKVLQGSEQLRERITQLHLEDTSYEMTAADMYSLRALKALSQLGLIPSRAPIHDCSEALGRSLTDLEFQADWFICSDTIAVFPGQITTLKKLRLSCPDQSYEGYEGVKGSMAAVSSLVELQDLRLEKHADWTAEEQQQALAGLTCLTHLELRRLAQPLALIPADTLVALDAALSSLLGRVADALFSMPALRRVEAWIVQPSEVWRGKVAQDCGIKELVLQGMESDEDLRNLPTMPALNHFNLRPFAGLAASHGRFVHLARFLQHHAATLETIIVSAQQEFSEVLPDLPECRVLELPIRTVGRGTLRVLTCALLPALEELALGGWLVNEDDQPDLAWLAWLAQLPALRILDIEQGWVGVVVNGEEPEKVLEKAVTSCLAGRSEVIVDFRVGPIYPWME